MEQVVAPEHVWRVSRFVRRAAAATSLVFVLIALLGTTAVTTGWVIAIWLLCILVMVSVWRWYLVPYVALTSEELVVQGVFAHKSVRYNAIRYVEPGLHGVRIDTENQGSFFAWAVQKSKFAEWSHRHTVADDVVAEIMARVEHASA